MNTLKRISFRARLVEDIDSCYWEFLGKKPTEQHQAAWQLLTRKPNLENAVVKSTDVNALQERFILIAQRRGFYISRIGRDKFLMTHKLPVIPLEPMKVNIDLKWSLWSQDESTFEERCPEVLERMQEAFNGIAAPLEIHTAPWKEIRCGTVTISKGKAEGTFACEWDEASELADTLGIECDDAFVECLPGSMYIGGIGMERSFSIKTRTFARMLELVDKEEDRLLKDDRKEWSMIEKMYSNAEVANSK